MEEEGSYPSTPTATVLKDLTSRVGARKETPQLRGLLTSRQSARQSAQASQNLHDGRGPRSPMYLASSPFASPYSVTVANGFFQDATPSVLFYPSHGANFWGMSPKQQQSGRDVNDVSMNFLSPKSQGYTQHQWDSNSWRKSADRSYDYQSEVYSASAYSGWNTNLSEADEYATTLMLRNVPNRYTTAMILEEIADRGLMCDIDFFYMPVDARHQRNVGYCFVNLTSYDAVRRFRESFQGAHLDKVKNEKNCQVGIGKVQGLEANIETYRNQPIMKMDEIYRPLLFSNGKRVSFPPPTTQEGALKERRHIEAMSTSTGAAYSGYSNWDAEVEDDEWATTLMLRNIPNKYSRDMLLEEIDARGLMRDIDFFYMPVDLRRQRNVGYCFVNLTSFEGVQRFRTAFEGAHLQKVKNDKICQVGLGKVQGRDANIEVYRNGTVMSMDEMYRPMLLKNGKVQPFPAPSTVRKPVQKYSPRKGKKEYSMRP